MIRLTKRALLLHILLSFTRSSSAADVYVSPRGSNNNNGTSQQPFQSLEYARDYVRSLISEGLKESIRILLREGTYSLSQPLVFGIEDSGTDLHSITYLAYPGEIPVISGGMSIENWLPSGDGSCQAFLPSMTDKIRDLYVNGHRAIRARHPDSGFFRVEAAGADRRTHFRFFPDDVKSIPDIDQAELIFYHDWSISRVPVDEIDTDKRILHVREQVGGPSSWAVMDWFEKHPRYFLENSLTYLNSPGEWIVNPISSTLQYIPRPDENPVRLRAVIPVSSQLLVIRGDLENKKPVKNLHFVGLTCSYTAWKPDDGFYWGRQACTFWSPGSVSGRIPHNPASPAAVEFIFAENCSFRKGKVHHIGSSAISLGRSCKNNRISETWIRDAGGNGIMIGEGQIRRTQEGQLWWEADSEQSASGNVIEDNLIEHCGKTLYGAVGIWIGLAGETTVQYNEIRALPYTGISVGWMWWDPKNHPEPRRTPCIENRIANNHIHHVMQMLSDGGGIYTLGIQPGTVLLNNLIHDVPANAGRAESNGLFLDQGTGSMLIEGNVIYGISKSPIRFHKGWKNRVHGNVLQVPEDAPVVRYNDTVESRIELSENTIVDNNTPASVLNEAIKNLVTATGPRIHPKADICPSELF